MFFAMLNMRFEGNWSQEAESSPEPLRFEYVVQLAPVVQRVDSAIQWINYYPLDNTINFDSTYPLDSDLSTG